MAAAVASNSNTEKRCAVVTGGNKGIGYGICEQLASQGIVVVLTARDEKRGLDALKKLKDSGFSDNVLFHQLDVADSSSVASLAQFIDEKFGNLDILVNNAGVGGVFVDVDAFRASVAGGGVPDFQKHMIQDSESVAECMQINYYGAKRMIEAFIPLLQKSQSPRIVNVSSSMGQLKLKLVDKMVMVKTYRVRCQPVKDASSLRFLSANSFDLREEGVAVLGEDVCRHEGITSKVMEGFQTQLEGGLGGIIELWVTMKKMTIN